MADMRVIRGALAEDEENTVVSVSRKGKYFDYSLLIILLVLIGLGLIVVYSSSYSVSVKKGDDAYTFINQVKYTIVGMFALAAATFIPLKFWRRFSLVILILSLISVALVRTSWGLNLNGAYRWFKIAGRGPSIQPAELVKIAIIIYMAVYISKYRKQMKGLKANLIYLLIAGFCAGVVLVITSNLSSALIILGISYIMLMISTEHIGKYSAVSIMIALLVAALLILFFVKFDSIKNSTISYRLDRLIAWVEPTYTRNNEQLGYQVLQSLYAIGSGGFFGKGLGQGSQRVFLPEAQSDMIFSIICEELGVFGGLCVIILYVLLIWRMVNIAINAPNLYSSLIVVGVIAHISLQVVLHIAVVTNLIPNTGITLPFISAGGSAAIMVLFEMGLVLNVSRLIQTRTRVPAESVERV